LRHVATSPAKGNNTNITRGAHGWIKEHTLH
jgi:hypothetical protein